LKPETFVSPQEAEAALGEYLRDLLEEFYAGHILHYDHEAYRIRYVSGASMQPHHQGENQ